MEKRLQKYIEEIKNLDQEAIKLAEARQDKLAKPPKSLGKLEDISIKFAGITGKTINTIEKGCIIILSSDNGVVEEGVASAPQYVTFAQTINFTKGLTGVGSLARTFGRQVCVLDMGVNSKFPKELISDDMKDFEKNKIINRKIAMGTKNLAKEKAMTREEALKAIFVGIEAVETVKEAGYDIIGVGEMGIGNTTTSACILSALTGCPEDCSVGRGGGINDESLKIKQDIVREKGLNTKYEDVLDIISSVGGFDICAMVGVYLAAAHERIPVVIDGYISAVGALAASRLCPISKEHFFGSHGSLEKGYGYAMKALEMDHMLELNMRLGEGSGCIIAMEIIKGALGVMKKMATFDEAAIDDEYLEEIREGEFY